MLEIMSAGGREYRGGEVAMDLDVSKRYSYIDKNETQWAFTYQNIANDEGWYVWRTAPGQIEMCIGRADEEQVAQKLMENPPLNQDDLIDLELWLAHGGLEKYKPRKERRR
jgi:hypothetical protein